MTTPSSSDSTGQLWVCPTSHLDWDWLDTFTEYFEVGPPDPDDAGYVSGAKAILTGVCQLLKAPTSFCYSLAEVAYLRAYLTANPGDLATLQSAGPARFALMGGGITSPDNLLCHGEVFIRNYLLGRQWLESAGLAANVIPVAWLPDDFGHDPQLPVALAAMGLRWLGISRVPGSVQPFGNQPVDKITPSVADQLENEGLVFTWTASDGSQVLTHFMPSTYGAVWDGSPGNIHALQTFAEAAVKGWPTAGGGRVLFAPAGGDFALSQWDGGNWQTILDQYNNTDRKSTDPIAKFGTFAQFMEQVAGSAGTPRSPLLAQNYWTGIFASRPSLKTLHYGAAQLAVAAEAAATLLRLTSTCSTTTLDDLDAAIGQAWQTLVPSSHHDYITGTSPDRVYWGEQLPMLKLAAQLAQQCLTQAVGLIAAGVTVPSGGIPVAVFNPVGFARGGVVELPAQAVPGSVAEVTFGSSPVQSQRAADGGLLFAVPEPVDSFGYVTATLREGPEQPSPALPSVPPGAVTMESDQVQVQIDPTKSWAITNLSCGGVPLLSGTGNSIRLYLDEGNIYQFGNEPLQLGQYKNFTDSYTSLAAGPGKWIENGPLRWHFQATVTGTYVSDYASQPVSYTLDYLLYRGEAAVRMRLTGAAPAQTTVVTAFDLLPAGEITGLTYGTANHYDDHEPTPYWPGPTFRATHDFAQTDGTAGTANPGLAVYHQGVPAWSVYGGQLIGALLRNNFGVAGFQRGASGTDPGVHTQEYAVGTAYHPVTTGDALRAALTVTSPLVAAVGDPNPPLNNLVGLPQQAGLAALSPTGSAGSPGSAPTGILRAARTQAGSSVVVPLAGSPGYYAEQMNFILRVYVPDLASVPPDGVTITLPSLPNPTPAIEGYDPSLKAVVVSALEEPLVSPPQVSVTRGTPSGDTVPYTVRFKPTGALTTIQLTAIRWPTKGRHNGT